jgi:hypothetical protein
VTAVSRERRTVRPFIGVGMLDRLLREARLTVGGVEVDVESGRMTVSPADFVQNAVDLALTPSDPAVFREQLRDGLSNADVAEDQASVVVIASSGPLRIEDVIASWMVDEVPATVRLASGTHRPRALRMPRGGCRLTVAVVLNRAAESRPLRPSLKATWLARRDWLISTDIGMVGFTPQVLDARTREKLQLPPRTMRFIECDDVTSTSSLEDSLTVYVDEGILGLLASAPSSDAARLLQQQLFLDVVRSALGAFGRVSTSESTVEPGQYEGSLIERIVRLAAGSKASSDELMTVWNDARIRPENVVARVENTLVGLIPLQSAVLGKLAQEE